MEDYLKSKEQLLKELGSDPRTGLTGAQAEESRARHGANVLTRQKQDSLWKRIAEAATEPMILMLIAAGLIALGVNVFRLLGVPESQMSTALFTLFVLFQLFNSFHCRELHWESIFPHLMKNKLMLSVVGCTFVLQVLIIQFAGAFFGTVPLDLALWLKLFAVASSVVVLSEWIKWIGRMIR